MPIHATAALPQELARLELTEDDLTIASYRVLAQKQHELGSIPFETALRLIVCLHGKNHGRPFELEYELAIVDVVLRALLWFDFEVERTYNALIHNWLLRYEHYEHARRHSIPCDALRRALTMAYST